MIFYFFHMTFNALNDFGYSIQTIYLMKYFIFKIK